MEIWKDIPGYEGIYKISTSGVVISYNYNHTKKEGVIKSRVTKLGYVNIGLHKDKKQKTFRLHRLVMLTFVGESKLPVNHKDGDKLNNSLENLEYCTQSENIKHAFRTGLSDNRKGEDHARSKLTEKQVLEIKELLKIGKYRQRDIADMFGVAQATICLINTGKNWGHLQ